MTAKWFPLRNSTSGWLTARLLLARMAFTSAKSPCRAAQMRGVARLRRSINLCASSATWPPPKPAMNMFHTLTVQGVHTMRQAPLTSAGDFVAVIEDAMVLAYTADRFFEQHEHGLFEHNFSLKFQAAATAACHLGLQRLRPQSRNFHHPAPCLRAPCGHQRPARD